MLYLTIIKCLEGFWIAKYIGISMICVQICTGRGGMT